MREASYANHLYTVTCPKFGDGERAIHLEEASCWKKKPSESYHNAARRRVKVDVC